MYIYIILFFLIQCSIFLYRDITPIAIHNPSSQIPKPVWPLHAFLFHPSLNPLFYFHAVVGNFSFSTFSPMDGLYTLLKVSPFPIPFQRSKDCKRGCLDPMVCPLSFVLFAVLFALTKNSAGGRME